MNQNQNKNDKENKPNNRRSSNLNNLFQQEEVKAVLVYENGKRYTRIIGPRDKS